MRRPFWFRVGFEAWNVGLEASSVIALRTIKILAGGPPGQAEVRLMVAEKFDTGSKLQTQALGGKLGTSPGALQMKTLRHYAKKVRANRRRLTRAPRTLQRDTNWGKIASKTLFL